MFGIGMQEIMIVLVIALLVIGPKKLPEVAKAMGKGYGEFRRAFEDMRNSINVDMKSEEEKIDLLPTNAKKAGEIKTTPSKEESSVPDLGKAAEKGEPPVDQTVSVEEGEGGDSGEEKTALPSYGPEDEDIESG